MDKSTYLEKIQHMHETRTVTNDAIIAWYHFYSHKLPRMHPERSEVDLVRTTALWMELTDRGGRPGFPYDYSSELSLISIQSSLPPKRNVSWLFGMLTGVVGIAFLFINFLIGIALIVACPLILAVGYRFAGGAANPNLIKEGTTLYEREGRRVFEWHEKRRPRSTRDA